MTGEFEGKNPLASDQSIIMQEAGAQYPLSFHHSISVCGILCPNILEDGGHSDRALRDLISSVCCPVKQTDRRGTGEDRRWCSSPPHRFYINIEK